MAEGQQDTYHESCRRNGWTLPLHVLQVFAWIVVLYFIVVYFTTLVPVLPTEWQPAGYIINGLACTVHLVCHLVAATINPADEAVLHKRFQSTIVRLDRTKHRHVIENQHCYLCEVNVGPKSKHCSACNKCVSDFDHHCKWLNNCIGGRNYRWFIITLVSALVCTVVILCMCFALFIGYFIDRNNGNVLQPFRDNLECKRLGNGTGSAVFKIMYQPVPDWAWLILVTLTGLLTLASVGLLIHLLSFHGYLAYNSMSTYDYIIKQRDSVKDEQPTYEDSKTVIAKCKKINRVMPSKKSADLENGMPRSDRRVARCLKRNAEQVDYLKEGETPPPSSSPLLRHKNKCTVVTTDSPTPVKKMKKKKKSKPHELTFDDSKLYDVKYDKNASNSHRTDYYSDSAESMPEVNRSKTTDVCSEDGAVVTSNHYSSQASLISSIAKQAKKKKKPKNASSDADDELNSTMVFTVNDNAKLNLDGSLDYSEGFKTLPLTPVLLRKRANEVPPLDFEGLRSSTESTNTYMPYTGTVRSTDTVLFTGERPLPSLKSVPESHVDTEV